jgi:hypothetical protein
MKTNLIKSTMHKGILRLVLTVLLGCTILIGVNGQVMKMKSHDYFLPRKGQSMVEFYTGSPYVAIGLYSYGISDRFSVGAIYGYTPFVKAFGLRIKSVIAQPSENFRISLKSPFLYYPHMDPNDNKSWVLAWPTMNFEWKLKNEARIWVGFGVVGAARTDYLRGERPYQHLYTNENHKEDYDFMAGIYNTFQFGYSKPISNKLSFVVEVAPVMQGFKLKSKDGFLDLIPVVVTTGLSYSF